jgi:hypothetical protein
MSVSIGVNRGHGQMCQVVKARVSRMRKEHELLGQTERLYDRRTDIELRYLAIVPPGSLESSLWSHESFR